MPKRNERTSARVAEHAGRITNSGDWNAFVSHYETDQDSWDAIQAVAASALTQTVNKKKKKAPPRKKDKNKMLGGLARARKLSPTRRTDIARKAAKKRWSRSRSRK